MTAFPSDLTIRQQAEASIASSKKTAEAAAAICSDGFALEIFMSRFASELVIADRITADEAAAFRKLADRIVRRERRAEAAERKQRVEQRLLAKVDAERIRQRCGGKFFQVG